MTAPNENVTNSSLTLGQRLAEGPLPLSEALRYAMMLAEALRQIHDGGRSCGALLPSSIAVTTTGLRLIITPSLSATITPYTAPEILQGHPQDCRSDIFAFGAIVYEMVTGHSAFTGDNADTLAASLTIFAPSPCGHPAFDHLVGNCTAKDPNVRYQRMQKVVLELKLLSFAVPRPETVAHRQSVTAALRAETQQLEARLAALQQAHGTALIEMQRASSDVISELCARLSSVESELAAASHA